MPSTEKFATCENILEALAFAMKKRRRARMPTMSLEEWRESQGLTVSKVADKLGLSISYTSEILVGRRVPSIDIQLRVEKATRGAVVMEKLRVVRQGIG